MFSFEMNTGEIMNGLYKDFVMDMVQECSDLPHFQDEWKPPLAAKTYTFNKCTSPSVNSYSGPIIPGTFKIVLEGKKGEEKIGVLEVEIESKE